VFGLVYFAGAELGHGLSLKTPEQTFATFWPPAGLLLAALVQTRFRSWPTLLLIAGVANLTSDGLRQQSLLVSLGFCVAHGVQACLGAWLLRRFAGRPLTLTRVKDVMGLAFCSAVLGPLAGATLGAAVVSVAFNGASYWSAWQFWWIGNAAGVLVVAPVVISRKAMRARAFSGIRPWRIVEGFALYFGTMLMTQGVYGEWLPSPLRVPIFLLPFLLWAALRFGPAGAAVALLTVAVIGLSHTLQGHGPYALMTAVPGERLMRAQATLGVASIAVLALAAAVVERRQADRKKLQLIGELEQALGEIKTLRGLIPLCAWCSKIRDDRGYWQRMEVYLRAHTEAEFTHGLCPDCLERQLANVERVGPERKEKAGTADRRPECQTVG
jgi:integral membrane sensor domain MASE1